MYSALKETILSAFSRKSTTIDGWTFWLFYRVTVGIICLSTFLLSSKQYFGEPIACKCDGVEAEIINPYCWAKGTYTIRELTDDKLKDEVTHPGVGLYDHRVHTKIFHRYYQWVPLVLSLMAVAFYLPRAIWSSLEKGLMESMTRMVAEKEADSEEHNKWVAKMANYFSRSKRGDADCYATKYFCCWLLNLIILGVQVYLTDLLLGGNFLFLGPNYIRHSSRSGLFDGPDEEVIPPLELTFPKVASCTFKMTGPSGSGQTFPALCVLPLNVLNEVIFCVLWFWYAIVMGLCALKCLSVVMEAAWANIGSCLLVCKSSYSPMNKALAILSFGQSFQLSQIEKNVPADHFEELLNVLNESLVESHGSKKIKLSTGTLVKGPDGKGVEKWTLMQPPVKGKDSKRLTEVVVDLMEDKKEAVRTRMQGRSNV